MDKFQQNDLVIVKRPSICYSGYFSFFKENNLPIDVAARFAYYEQPKFQGVFRVLSKGKPRAGDDTIYCIESADMHRSVYLMGEQAMDKIGVADMENFDEAVGSTDVFFARG